MFEHVLFTYFCDFYLIVFLFFFFSSGTIKKKSALG